MSDRKVLSTWTPNPGPQAALFECPADIILYGGAAGGGKTDAAIVWAAAGHSFPGYRALVLRRSFPELERHIISRARQLFPERIAHYNQRSHTLTFKCPGGGESVVEFGYLETEADVENYQGSEYARIAVDESTKFSERQVRNLLRFNRSTVQEVRRQMLLCTNPIGPGYGWHYLTFVKDHEVKRIYRDASWASDNRPIGLTTCFIPARLRDNPILLANDPEYISKLRTQEGPIAEALIEGRWDVVQNTALDFDYISHTCDIRALPDWALRWMGVDWGRMDKAAAVWLASDDRRVYAYRDFARPGREIKPFAYEIAEKCRDEKIQFCVLSHECFAQHGTNLTQADQFREIFDHYNIPLVPSDRDAEGRLLLLREFLRTRPLNTEKKELNHIYWIDKLNREGAKGMDEYRRIVATVSDRDLPRLLIFRPSGELGCPYLIQSLPLLMLDLDYPRSLADHQDDHGFDALGHALKAYMGQSTLPAEAIYRYNLHGQIPDSTMAVELGMKRAQEIHDSLNPSKPVAWPFERFGK